MANTKSQLRGFQDRMANQGWRIQWIPADDGSRPVMIQTNWFAVIGMIAFVWGCWSYFRSNNLHYIEFAIGGFVFALAGLWLTARFKRAGWVRVPAECVDRELRQCFDGKTNSWDFRILCRFDFAGKQYSATPAFWRTFTSEEALKNFLAARIGADGRCQLHINPKNPRQAELVAGDLADKVLY